MAIIDSAAEKIRVECDSCGGVFRVAATKAGKRGPCPKCGETITVPQPAAAEEEVDLGFDSSAQTEEDDGYRLADDLPAAAPPPVARPKPPVGPASRPLQYATPASRAAAKAATATPEPEGGAGRFVLGTVLACVFAVVGCGVWLTLAVLLGMEFGILAWALGAAIGGGMVLGYGTRTAAAGLTAGGIALGTVFLTKALPALAIVLFGWGMSAALAPAPAGPYTPLAAQMELPELLVDDLVRADGLDYDTTTEDQDAQYYDAAAEKVKTMDPATLELTYKRQLVHERMQMDQFNAAFDLLGEDDFDEDAQLVDYAGIDRQVEAMDAAGCDTWLASYTPAASSGPGFWGAMGMFVSPWDILWTILAVASAYKISGL